jgi:hypothetical protein
MDDKERLTMSDFDIDNARIEEIDLGVLAKYFKVLDRFFNSEDISDVHEDGEQPSVASTKSRLIDFLLCSRMNHYIERQIALRMMFDNISSAPQCIAEAERVLGIRL